MTSKELLRNPRRVGRVVLLSLLLGLAPAAMAAIDLSVLPSTVTVQPGEVFDVELTVTPAGSAFNGYDAVIGFDPSVLTFIQRPRADQEGPLMTAACSNRFHVFSVAPAGDTLDLSHVLLCAGTSVTGPGVVYRLRFQAGLANGTTAISLKPGTAFYLAGLYVNPVFTHAAEIRIGGASPVPGSAVAADPRLNAAPNPFNPSTVISFEAAVPTRARITIHSLRGELVAELLHAEVPAGRNAVAWDGRDDGGRPMASGIYTVHLELGGESFLRRVTLIK